MQHPNAVNPNANRPISIEVEGEPLGVVIPQQDGFRFLAVRLNAFAIDGQIFGSVADAREAARLAITSEDAA